MKNDERRIENAPEPLRKELERLLKSGLLRDPAFLHRVKDAAEKVAKMTEEEWAAGDEEKPKAAKPTRTMYGCQGTHAQSLPIGEAFTALKKAANQAGGGAPQTGNEGESK